jgi:hypothetical protein
MKKILLITIVVLVSMGLFYSQIVARAAKSDEVTYLDAAWKIAEAICLKVNPPLDTFPKDERFTVMVNAFAARGIDEFQGVNPTDTLTVGEAKEIYDSITSGVPIEYSGEKQKCPVEVAEIFALPNDQKISKEDFDKISGCFPFCDADTVEAYTPPAAPRFVPPGPEPRSEEPASEL